MNANEADPGNRWAYGHDWHGYTGVDTARQALFRPMLRPHPAPGLIPPSRPLR